MRQPRTSFSQTSEQPVTKANPVQAEPTQEPSQRQAREPERDLFSNWDIKREDSQRDVANLDSEKPQRTFQRPSNEVPNRQTEGSSDNDELDTPPFFRKRNRN